MRRTLANATDAIEGVGLFTAAPSRVRFAPHNQGTPGIAIAINGREPFSATLDSLHTQPLHPAFAQMPARSTNLASATGVAATVEHAMAALAGLGVTDAVIEIDCEAPAAELPIMDGSAGDFARAILAAGTTEIDGSSNVNANKARVLEYTKQVLQERDYGKLQTFVSQDIIQHAPMISSGRDGLAAWLASDDAGQYEMMFQLLGMGDMIVTYGKRHAQGRDIAVFNLYRLVDGLIVEHWMNEEEIAPRTSWGNSGKF